MRRIVWLKVGDTKLHLIKLAGSFLIVTFMLKVMEAAYHIFLTVDKIAKVSALTTDRIPEYFGWTMSSTVYPGAPMLFSAQDIVGKLLGQSAEFMFWLGMLVVALMVYQAGKFYLPIEEYEQVLPEHHRRAIVEAVRAHRAKLEREATARRRR